MKSAHIHHKHIEQASSGLNTVFGALVIIAAFGALFMNGGKLEHKHREPERLEHVGNISEMDYLIAVSSAKQKAKPLTQAQLAEMDRKASLQTRPEDVARLKPKAKAAYYASLNNKSIWSAVNE